MTNVTPLPPDTDIDILRHRDAAAPTPLPIDIHLSCDPKNVWVEPKSSHLSSLLLLVFGTAASVRLKENQTLVANGKFQGKRRSSIKFESYQKRSHFCIPK